MVLSSLCGILQQISTLAGNLVPSDFVWEVLFTMGIVGLGLFLFALLIGNMQNFLQSLGRRRLEMQLRRRDVEQWMRHRRLPDNLKRQVRQAERFSWAATRGVNEEELMSNLPEDLQREIRRHLFKFLKKIRSWMLTVLSILSHDEDSLLPIGQEFGSLLSSAPQSFTFLAQFRFKSPPIPERSPNWWWFCEWRKCSVDRHLRVSLLPRKVILRCVTFAGKRNMKIVSNLPDSVSDWKSKFFYARFRETGGHS
ncbi:hypothetical protein ACLOJK_006709 [Asimina triloba]